MTIQFHEPRADARKPDQPYRCRLAQAAEPTLGLLANGFPDSEAFLDAIAAAIMQARPGVRIRRYNKHGASVPAQPDLIDTIVAECDAVVTAYGH